MWSDIRNFIMIVWHLRDTDIHHHVYFHFVWPIINSILWSTHKLLNDMRYCIWSPVPGLYYPLIFGMFYSMKSRFHSQKPISCHFWCIFFSLVYITATDLWLNNQIYWDHRISVSGILQRLSFYYGCSVDFLRDKTKTQVQMNKRAIVKVS